MLDLGAYTWKTRPLILKTNKLYKIEITYDEELTSYYYYTLPYGSNIQSGATIDYRFSSGDSIYTTQDSTIDIISSQESGDNKIANTIDNFKKDLLNTNISSGDEPKIEDFPTYVVDDPTINFFDYLINRISNLFLNNNPTTLSITIPYLINEPYILSSEFFVLSGPLLLFIQSFFFIWFIVPKLSEIHEVIKAMQMGYTDTFINYFGYGISIDELL